MLIICLSHLLSSMAYILLSVATSYISGIQGQPTPGKIGEWRFDKRSYDNVVPPRNLPLPPPGVPESVVRVLYLLHVDDVECCLSMSEIQLLWLTWYRKRIVMK